MKTKRNKQRSVIAVIMQKRYANTTTIMNDRRKERGGAKNRKHEFLDESY